MQAQRRKGISAIFIFMYVVFTLVLGYLLFFNTGIEIRDSPNPFTGARDVYIVNATDRIINNVQVSYRDGGVEKDFNAFATLGPKEKRLLDTGFLSPKAATIIVRAPFHVQAEKLVDLNPRAGKPVSIDIPKSAVLGQPFNFSVQICNYSGSVAPVRAEEIHDPLAFFSPNGQDSFTLGLEECRKLEYSLVAGKEGETTIYFNVNFSNSNEQFQKTVSVLNG